MEKQFTNDNSWRGGFYELSIEVGPRSDERLQQLLEAIWKVPYLKGCYLDRDKEPEAQTVLKPSLEYLNNNGHLYGIATLPDKREVVCGTVAILEMEKTDWLDLYIPLGVLGHIYEEMGGFPFTDSGVKSQSWRQPLENWLAEIGQIVFSMVPFRLGLIGFEVCGQRHRSETSKNDIQEERRIGYLWPNSKGIQYLPTNKW
jgi:hypothetical protein